MHEIAENYLKKSTFCKYLDKVFNVFMKNYQLLTYTFFSFFQNKIKIEITQKSNTFFSKNYAFSLLIKLDKHNYVRSGNSAVFDLQ